MGRAPCFDKQDDVKKGPWTPDEDQKLMDYIQGHGHGSWRTLPKRAGLLRCGKSCRLRWTNYLRPDIKRGKFSFEEEQTIIQLHGVMGNKWSAIASHLPGRTDNEIKNHWNTHLKKRLLHMGIDPVTHRPRLDLLTFANMNQFVGPSSLNPITAQWEKARMQEAIMREYYVRVLQALMMMQNQEKAYQNNQNTGSINFAYLLMRSQIENSFSRPDFNCNSILPQTCTHTPDNLLGSLDYNTLVSRVLQQLQSQSQPQILNNTLHCLNPDIEPKDNDSVQVPSSSRMNCQAGLLPQQKPNIDELYNNLFNDLTVILQQDPPSETQDINSSVAVDSDSSVPWAEDNLFGFSSGDSECFPALTSSTSSPVLKRTWYADF